MKLKATASKGEDSIGKTLTYCNFLGEHKTCIHTDNVIVQSNQ